MPPPPAPRRAAVGLAVGAGRQLVTSGAGARRAGHVGLVAPAGGDHDVGGPPGRVRGRHDEPLVGRRERRRRRCAPRRGVEGGGVVGEVGDQLGGGHEAVGVGALVRPAGQAAGPVGGQEAEGLPAVAPPPLGQAAALEHDVVDGGVGEAAAHGEAGLAGADDEGVDGRHRCAPGADGVVAAAGRVRRPGRSGRGVGGFSRRRRRWRPGRRWSARRRRRSACATARRRRGASRGRRPGA